MFIKIFSGDSHLKFDNIVNLKTLNDVLIPEVVDNEMSLSCLLYWYSKSEGKPYRGEELITQIEEAWINENEDSNESLLVPLVILIDSVLYLGFLIGQSLRVNQALIVKENDERRR